MVAYWGRKMKDLFSPDSHWHDLGEVKYELLFPRRLLLQFLQHDDFPKALSELECVTYLPFPEQWEEQSRLAAPLKEPGWDGNGRGATAEGIVWEFTPSLVQQSWPTFPRRKRRGQCLLLNPEARHGCRIIPLAFPPLGGILRLREKDWRGPALHSFGRQSQQKGGPMTSWMVSVSRLSMYLQEVISTLETACWEFSIQFSIITFPPTPDFLDKTDLWKIKIIFVASSLFLMEWLNAQEVKLLGAGVLMEWVDSSDCFSRKHSFILQSAWCLSCPVTTLWIHPPGKGHTEAHGWSWRLWGNLPFGRGFPVNWLGCNVKVQKDLLIKPRS